MGDVKLAGDDGPLPRPRRRRRRCSSRCSPGRSSARVVMARKGVAEGRKTALPFGPFLAFGGARRALRRRRDRRLVPRTPSRRSGRGMGLALPAAAQALRRMPITKRDAPRSPDRLHFPTSIHSDEGRQPPPIRSPRHAQQGARPPAAEAPAGSAPTSCSAPSRWRGRLAVYVLAGNAVKDREAELATRRPRAQNARQRAAALKPYADFEALASQRVHDGALARRRALRLGAARSSDLSRALPKEVGARARSPATSARRDGRGTEQPAARRPRRAGDRAQGLRRQPDRRRPRDVAPAQRRAA